MKIMIVDDEVIIRSGLAQVIKWKEMGIELLEPADSAEEALERMELEKPDILLTDILMSGMTGLQLAEEAKRMLPRLEVIILSGYDDFAYTQQAIRQQVSDYLLKKSKPEEIIKTVLKVKRKLEDGRQMEDRNEQERRLERIRRKVSWVVHGEYDAVCAEWLPASPNHQWQVLLVEPTGWGTNAQDHSLLLFAIGNAIKELLPSMRFEYESRMVLVVPAALGDEARIQRSARFAQLERMLKCRLVVAGGLAESKPEQLHDSYQTALEAIAYRTLVNTNIWEYAEIADRKGGKTILTQEEEKALSVIMLQNDPLALQRWVRKYAEGLLADMESTPQTIQAAMQSVALAGLRWLDRVLAAAGSREEREQDLPPYRFDIGKCELDSLYQYLFDMMKYVHRRLDESKLSHVQRAMIFIEERVGRELSLIQVAEHVHLHPNHLSELFKKETGIKFVDYVTRTRMQRAAELLASTPAKVSEIASAVGYEDMKYFSGMFKKFTGLTPNGYREQLARQQRQDDAAIGSRPQQAPEQPVRGRENV